MTFQECVNLPKLLENSVGKTIAYNSRWDSIVSNPWEKHTRLSMISGISVDVKDMFKNDVEITIECLDGSRIVLKHVEEFSDVECKFGEWGSFFEMLEKNGYDF